MLQLSRRQLLQASSAISIGALAGCLSTDIQPATESPASPSKAKEDTASFMDWERSTDCDGMHDSIIRVEQLTTSLGDEYAPIYFANLSPEEKTILRTVTDEGGYGTCDTSDAFQRFVRRVSDHGGRQNAERMRVYLERNGTYYRLYVEDLDQVYAA